MLFQRSVKNDLVDLKQDAPAVPRVDCTAGDVEAMPSAWPLRDRQAGIGYEWKMKRDERNKWPSLVRDWLVEDHIFNHRM